jgi:hypothetical protein
MSRHYWQEPKPIRVIRSSKRAGVRRIEVTSSSDARRHYTVTCKNGKWACSCLGWIVPRNVKQKNGEIIRMRNPCRHIKKFAPEAVGIPVRRKKQVAA